MEVQSVKRRKKNVKGNGSDDDNLSKANISEATMNGKKLPIKNDMIELKGIHNEGEKNILRVKLEEKTRRTLEVRAYAKH